MNMKAIRCGLACISLFALPTSGCQRTDEKSQLHDGPSIELDANEINELVQGVEYLNAHKDSLKATRVTSSQDELKRLERLERLQVFELQRQLASLGYGTSLTGEVDAQTMKALSLFRSFHRLDSLKLDGPAIQLAVRSAFKSADIPFRLPNKRVNTTSWSSTVYAVGTWDNAEPPLQTSKIWCYKPLGYCQEVTALLRLGELTVDDVLYDVQKWDQNDLEAKRSAPCFYEILNVNRKSGRVLRISRPHDGGSGDCRESRPEDFNESILLDGRTVGFKQSQNAVSFYRLSAELRKIISDSQKK